MTIRSMPRRRYFTPIPGCRAAYLNTTQGEAAPAPGCPEAMAASQKDWNIGILPSCSTPARRTGPTISYPPSPHCHGAPGCGRDVWRGAGGRAAAQPRDREQARRHAGTACRPFSRAPAPATSRSRWAPSTRRRRSLSTTSHADRHTGPPLNAGAYVTYSVGPGAEMILKTLRRPSQQDGKVLMVAGLAAGQTSSGRPTPSWPSCAECVLVAASR